MLYEQFLELYHSGKYSEALPVAEKYAAQIRDQYGENHFEYAIALNNLAEIYRTQNRLDDAEQLFSKAMQIEEVTLGPYHENVAIRLYNLARLNDDRERYDTAISLLYRALEVWEKALGPEHHQLGIALNTLGEIYIKQGRGNEAESLFEHALRICENALGRDHTEVSTIVKNLGTLYFENGFPDEARPLLRRVLEIEEKNFGPTHVNLTDTLATLALVYQDLGQHDELEAALQRSLKIFGGSFAEDHPAITDIYSQLTSLYIEQERLEEAAPLVKKAFGAHKMILGMQHPTTALDLYNLAEIERHTGQYEEAEPKFKHALEVLGKAYGLKHLFVGRVFNSMAELYFAQSKMNDAIRLFNFALEIYQKNYHTEHIKIGMIYYYLGKILEDREDYNRASPFYKRAMEIFEKQPGQRHPLLVEVMYSLGKIAHKSERYEEAESLYKVVLKSYEETVGSKHNLVADLLLNFTSLYEVQGKYEEASPLYEYALDIRKEQSVSNDPQLALAYLKIANSYKKQNNWSKAYEAFETGNRIITHCLRNNQRQFIEELSLDDIPIIPWSFVEQARTTYDISQKQPDMSQEFRSKGFEYAQLAHSVSSLAIFERLTDGYDGEDETLAELLSDKMELTSKWRGNYEKLQETLAHPSKTQDKMAEATQRKLLENIDENIERLDENLAEDFPDYNDLFSPSSLSIEETRQQLRKDEALVQFVFGKTEGLVWVITNDDDYWSPLQIGTEQLKDKVEKLRFGLDHTLWQTMGSATRGKELLGTDYNWGDYSQGQPLPFDLTVANELYRDLFFGVSQYIEDMNLLIVAPAPLSQIPLSVLVTDDKKKGIPDKYAEYRKVSWLGLQHGVSVIPSVTCLRALRGTLEINEPAKSYLGICQSFVPNKKKQKVKVEKTDKLSDGEGEKKKKLSLSRMANFSRGVLIDSNLLQYDIPEPDSLEEMYALSGEFSADDREFIYGDDAQLSNLRDLDDHSELRDYGIIHFGCPVITSYEGQELFEPTLLISEDEALGVNSHERLLRASDIAQMHLNANWILLPAAHKAADDETGDKYVMSLSRAFFFSGAQTVFANRWEVNAESGSKILKEIFKVQEDTPDIGRSDALKKAIENLIQDKSRPWNPHPSTWGAYMLIGEASAS